MHRGDAVLHDRRQDALRAPVRDALPCVTGKPSKIDRASLRVLSAQERHLLYGYGYLIAEAIGIEGLREFDSDEIEHRRAAVFLVDGLAPPRGPATVTQLRHGLTVPDV